MHTSDATNLQAQLMTHLIDSATMKADIDNLKQSDRETNQRVLTMLGELVADMKALRNDLGGVPAQIAAGKTDMRAEIERDFPSKTEAMAMEQRIEKQLSDTDKTLGKQISEVDKKLDSGMADVTAQITKVDSKVDKIWIKITVVVATIVVVGGLIQWLLLTSKMALNVFGK